MKVKTGKVICTKRSIFYSLLFIITVSILTVSLAWYIIEKQQLKHDFTDLNNRESGIQKAYLQNEVEKTLAEIEFLKNYHKVKILIQGFSNKSKVSEIH